MSGSATAQGANPAPFFKVLRGGRPDPVLALVFSHVHEPAGRFTFERTVGRLGADAVLLNVPDRSYYLRGVPGLGDSVAATAAALRSLIGEIQPRAVAAIGLSMGAFGAALYGALLGIDRVLVLGGETLLQLPRSRSEGFIAGRFAPSHPDLRPLIRAAASTRFDFVFGENDLIDLYSAWRVRDLANVRVLPVRRAPHEIARWLQQRNALNDFLAAFLADEPLAPLLELGTTMDGPTAAGDLYGAQAAFFAGEAEIALMRLQPALPVLADCLPAHFYFGRALERTGRHAAAVEAFRRAVAIDPGGARQRLGLARALLATGRPDDVESAIEPVLARQPGNAQAHHLHGMALSRQGAFDAAIEAQQRATAIEPDNATYRAALASLGRDAA
jgi:tetratricopeptide (TPR) repeat protein